MGRLLHRCRSDGGRYDERDLERARGYLVHLQGRSVTRLACLSRSNPRYQCADTIAILPELDELVSWLPVDYTAKSIVELVELPTTADSPVYHVLHPTRIPWSAVLAALRVADLCFKALRASDPDERRNPSRKLLAFYESKYGAEEESTRAGLCVEKTMEASRWLRATPVVGEELVAKLVGAWRESGVLPKV